MAIVVESIREASRADAIAALGANPAPAAVAAVQPDDVCVTLLANLHLERHWRCVPPSRFVPCSSRCLQRPARPLGHCCRNSTDTSRHLIDLSVD